MALVPYRVSGPAADQRATERLLQFPGGIALRLTQGPALRGAAASQLGTGAACGELPAGQSTLDGASVGCTAVMPAIRYHHDQPHQQQEQQQRQRQGPSLRDLASVGLVVWQAGFLLADFLLREAPECTPRRRGGAAPAADWRSLTVVDLGTGSGVVGIALALAGARVFLTDLPHIVPLAAANVAGNCDPRVHRACVCAYCWGDDPALLPAAQVPGDAQVGDGGSSAVLAPSPLGGVEPDVITAADVLYHEDLLQPLMAALQRLSAPHTVSYVSYRVRQGGEVAAFLALVEAAGFSAEEVPDAALHEEYRRGGCRDAASAGSGGAGSGGSLQGAGAGMEVSDGENGLAVIEDGGARRWVPGTYGILRLCRRECVVS